VRCHGIAHGVWNEYSGKEPKWIEALTDPRASGRNFRVCAIGVPQTGPLLIHVIPVDCEMKKAAALKRLPRMTKEQLTPP